MNKITVSEYARKYNVTRQTVYNQIKKGLLNSVEENGTTFVIEEDIKVTNKDKDQCQKLVKKLLKRIDKLEKQLEEERKSKDALILAYVEEMKALYLPKPKKKKKPKNKKENK